MNCQQVNRIEGNEFQPMMGLNDEGAPVENWELVQKEFEQVVAVADTENVYACKYFSGEMIYFRVLDNEDPICPKCRNTVDDIHPDTGVCEYCMETPDQRAAREVDEAIDAFDSGRPMSDWDR